MGPAGEGEVMFEFFVIVGCIYCATDFILGIALRRCVLPGLKCKTCRRGDEETVVENVG